MREIKLVIFDWDGTLADSAAQIVGAMQRASSALRLPPRSDEAIAELIGLSLNDALVRLYPDADLGHLRRLLDSYRAQRSEEHTSELQSLMRNSYAVFCLKKKKIKTLDW